MTPTTNTGTFEIVAGFVLSSAILVITFLDPAFISHAVATLLVSIIYLAGITFHISIVGQLNQQIAKLSPVSAKKKLAKKK